MSPDHNTVLVFHRRDVAAATKRRTGSNRREHAVDVLRRPQTGHVGSPGTELEFAL